MISGLNCGGESSQMSYVEENSMRVV